MSTGSVVLQLVQEETGCAVSDVANEDEIPVEDFLPIIEELTLDQLLAAANDWLKGNCVPGYAIKAFDIEGAKRAEILAGVGQHLLSLEIAAVCCRPRTIVEFVRKALCAHPDENDSVRVMSIHHFMMAGRRLSG